MVRRPTFTREVEAPRARASGAAVVLATSTVLFAAVGLSAFAVRWRALAQPACPLGDRWALAPVGESAARSTAANSSPDLAIYEQVRQAESTGRDGDALEAYAALPADHPARATLAPKIRELSRDYVDDEMELLAQELTGKQCAAVRARIAKLKRLIPDLRIETALCD